MCKPLQVHAETTPKRWSPMPGVNTRCLRKSESYGKRVRKTLSSGCSLNVVTTLMCLWRPTLSRRIMNEKWKWVSTSPSKPKKSWKTDLRAFFASPQVSHFIAAGVCWSHPIDCADLTYINYMFYYLHLRQMFFMCIIYMMYHVLYIVFPFASQGRSERTSSPGPKPTPRKWWGSVTCFRL